MPSSPLAAARTGRRHRSALTALVGLVAALFAVVPSPAAAAGGGPVRVMPLGDSITEGSDGSTTYRYHLWHRLAAGGHAVDLVGSRSGVAGGSPRHADFDQDHEGHVGWRADQLLDGRSDRGSEGKLAEWVRAARPDVVLLHIGTNDLRQCQSVASTVEEIERIVATLRSARPEVAVAVARIIPTTASADRPCARQVPARAVELNDAIESLASRLTRAGAPVVAVDQHSGFDVGGDTTDGVHPNDGGEAKMAARWATALQPLLAAGHRPGQSDGYWMAGGTGTVHAFGGAPHCGDLTGTGRESVDLEPFADGLGYWVLEPSGRVSAFACQGAAPRAAGVSFAAQLAAGERAVSMSSRPGGTGYWVFTDRGRAFAAGTATAHGDLAGVPLNGPVLDSVATPSGRGYWMVASDGGIFAFGDAEFAGSMGGQPLNQPVRSMVADPDGRGYWLVASDGGVFAFDAPFVGSMGGKPLNSPVTGMVGSTTGRGYLMVGRDGGAFTFGDVAFHGSLGSAPPPYPIVSIAVRPA